MSCCKESKPDRYKSEAEELPTTSSEEEVPYFPTRQRNNLRRNTFSANRRLHRLKLSYTGAFLVLLLIGYPPGPTTPHPTRTPPSYFAIFMQSDPSKQVVRSTCLHRKTFGCGTCLAGHRLLPTNAYNRTHAYADVGSEGIAPRLFFGKCR